ncbi:MAG TPA: hypothetical protein VLX64_02215 [Thermoplasmata archaeon]|nr:hypothetical protein [Thermoplasmata archaeon]HUJ77800.1 hypothetical protein [Thermoplasmata archaeon]
MNVGPARALALALAIAFGGVAVWAGPNEATSVPAAGLALVAGVAFAVLSLLPSVRIDLRAAPPPEYDRLVVLRDAFREGAFGRQRIAQAIGELERASGPAGATRSGADPVLRNPESLPAPEFREWVRARLRELEERT